MRHIVLTLLTAITLLLPAGCGKMPINGALDANWQITSIQYNDDNTTDPDCTL